MARFVVEIRKNNKLEYLANSIYLILTGILRHMRENGTVGWNFLDTKDDRFTYLHRVLNAKIKGLTRNGVGTDIKRADVISVEDENKLWEKGVFGNSSCQFVINTLYFYNAKFFHLRACDEHRRIKLNDITLGEASRAPFLELCGNSAKNVPGGLADP